MAANYSQIIQTFKSIFSYSHVNILLLLNSKNTFFDSRSHKNDFQEKSALNECWPGYSTSSSEIPIQFR